MELRKEMMRKRKEKVSGEGKDIRTLLKEAKLSQKQKVCYTTLNIKIYTYQIKPLKAWIVYHSWFNVYLPFFQQAIEDQLSYEEATRKTLSALNEKLANMVAIFEVAKGEKLIQHIPSLSKVVLASLPSPLATGHCQQLWGVLCHSVFKQWILGKQWYSLCLMC